MMEGGSVSQGNGEELASPVPTPHGPHGCNEKGTRESSFSLHPVQGELFESPEYRAKQAGCFEASVK